MNRSNAQFVPVPKIGAGKRRYGFSSQRDLLPILVADFSGLQLAHVRMFHPTGEKLTSLACSI